MDKHFALPIASPTDLGAVRTLQDILIFPYLTAQRGHKLNLHSRERKVL